jgi:hypothetical protein
MYKKIIVAVSLTLFCQAGFAETCPSIFDIKSHSLTGWKAYDSDNGTPIQRKRVVELANHIDQFALAEWTSNNHAKGTVHCYYRDKHGSNLEAYFAKDHFKPDNSKNVWYEVSGFMHCAASMDKCAFQNNKVKYPQQQLAKN